MQASLKSRWNFAYENEKHSPGTGFAITLEPKRRSASPTMPIYVFGKVTG